MLPVNLRVPAPLYVRDERPLILPLIMLVALVEVMVMAFRAAAFVVAGLMLLLMVTLPLPELMANEYVTYEDSTTIPADPAPP